MLHVVGATIRQGPDFKRVQPKFFAQLLHLLHLSRVQDVLEPTAVMVFQVHFADMVDAPQVDSRETPFHDIPHEIFAMLADVHIPKWYLIGEIFVCLAAFHFFFPFVFEHACKANMIPTVEKTRKATPFS